MVTLTLLVHWLHVGAAMVWVGIQVAVALLIFPALATRPASEAQVFLGAFVARIPKIMAVSGIMILGLGLIRGTVLGPIRTWSALGSRYALMMGIATIVMFAMVAYGQKAGPTLMAKVWDGDAVRPGAQAALRRHMLIVFTFIAIITLSMVAMRFGV